MIAALTGIGLSAAAGLNAYIPFLIVALIAKYTDVITLPASYAWMESWWAIGIGAVLLLTELVLDKVPAIDSISSLPMTSLLSDMSAPPAVVQSIAQVDLKALPRAADPGSEEQRARRKLQKEINRQAKSVSPMASLRKADHDARKAILEKIG